ncbi:P-loop containing nucleoside triphosphate hydrolase protein, partial [Gonapodya prolifera JEL478]
LKFVLLGEGGTGKTQIARRFCTLPFINAHQHTTGLDLYHKKLTLDGASTWVELWDVSGESLSSRFAPNIVADADAIFLVYDVTHFGSFQSMDEWLRLVYR